MKRSPLVIAGTAVGLFGVLNFQSSPLTVNLNGTSGGSTGTSSHLPSLGLGRTTTNAVTTATSASDVVSVQLASVTSSYQSATVSAHTATTTTTVKKTGATTTTTVPKSATAVGNIFLYGNGVIQVVSTCNQSVANQPGIFGCMAVQVTVAGGKITGLTVAKFADDGNPQSIQRDNYGISYMKQEILKTSVTAMTQKRLGISAASQATYTSAAYAYSAQSALVKLGYKLHA